MPVTSLHTTTRRVFPTIPGNARESGASRSQQAAMRAWQLLKATMAFVVVALTSAGSPLEATGGCVGRAHSLSVGDAAAFHSHCPTDRGIDPRYGRSRHAPSYTRRNPSATDSGPVRRWTTYDARTGKGVAMVAGGIRVRALFSTCPSARAGNAAAKSDQPEEGRADAREPCRGVATHRGRSSA